MARASVCRTKSWTQARYHAAKAAGGKPRGGGEERGEEGVLSCEREQRKAGTSSSSHATRRSVPARPPHQESRRLQPSPRAFQVGLQGQALRAQLLQGQLPSQVIGRSHKVLSRGGRGRATQSEARCTLALPLACSFSPPPDCHSPLPPPPPLSSPCFFLTSNVARTQGICGLGASFSASSPSCSSPDFTPASKEVKARTPRFKISNMGRDTATRERKRSRQEPL